MHTRCVRMKMKILEPLISKIHIILQPTQNGIEVDGLLFKNGNVRKRFPAQVIEGKEALEREVKRLSREGALSYVSVLESEAKQGVVSSCSGEAIEALTESEVVCIEKRWGLYIDKDDLFERQKAFRYVGLDLLFSPFSILHNFFKNRINSEDGLYLLLTEGFIAAVVFQEQKALFGAYELLDERHHLLDSSKMLQRYVESVQGCIKTFYDTKIDESMFIEHVSIADTLSFDTRLENSLEEVLFTEVTREEIDLGLELALLAEKEVS